MQSHSKLYYLLWHTLKTWILCAVLGRRPWCRLHVHDDFIGVCSCVLVPVWLYLDGLFCHQADNYIIKESLCIVRVQGCCTEPVFRALTRRFTNKRPISVNVRVTQVCLRLVYEAEDGELAGKRLFPRYWEFIVLKCLETQRRVTESVNFRLCPHSLPDSSCLLFHCNPVQWLNSKGIFPNGPCAQI